MNREEDIQKICLSALDWAKDHDYKGWDPYDGLNSQILRPLRRHWFMRLLAIHGVNKAPMNLHPVLRVPKERNPKGIALFATTYLNLYETTGEKRFLQEAESLLDWLVDNQSTEFELPCWGYNFDWQNGRKFFLPAYHPSIVVTVFCGRALYRHYELTNDDQSLKTAIEAAEFIQKHINKKSIESCEVFTYTPYDSFVVINANALAADYFYQLSLAKEDNNLQKRSEELFAFVCEAQAPDGAWYYSMPASESHLSHDNFHTGFVLESLHDYAKDEPSDKRIMTCYERGIQFYREHLFEADGAPKFESNKRHPYDAHAAAQGIITFVQRGTQEDIEFATKIATWARNNLYDDKSYFYRRIGRVFRDETSYMRWSQGWMCLALSRLYAEKKKQSSDAVAL